MRKFTLAIALVSFLATGCAPPWSLRMSSFSSVPPDVPLVVDLRPDEARKFRFVDFAKLSYKSYLADSNTNPGRIEALEIRAGAAGLLAADRVEVLRFDILNDSSGSACKGCAVAAVSYAGAVGSEAGRKVGEDLVTCNLDASLNGSVHSAVAQVPYKVGAFDGPSSDSFALATDRCVRDVIDAWLAEARS